MALISTVFKNSVPSHKTHFALLQEQTGLCYVAKTLMFFPENNLKPIIRVWCKVQF